MVNNTVVMMLMVDEKSSHKQRESLRAAMFNVQGVVAADFPDDATPVMNVVYNPEVVHSFRFFEVAGRQGLHAELIGL